MQTLLAHVTLNEGLVLAGVYLLGVLSGAVGVYASVSRWLPRR